VVDPELLICVLGVHCDIHELRGLDFFGHECPLWTRVSLLDTQLEMATLSRVFSGRVLPESLLKEKINPTEFVCLHSNVYNALHVRV